MPRAETYVSCQSDSHLIRSTGDGVEAVYELDVWLPWLSSSELLLSLSLSLSDISGLVR